MGNRILQPSPYVPGQVQTVEQFGEFFVIKIEPPGMVVISKGTPDDMVACFRRNDTEFVNPAATTAQFLFRLDHKTGGIPYTIAWVTFVEKAQEFFNLTIPENLKPVFVDTEEPYEPTGEADEDYSEYDEPVDSEQVAPEIVAGALESIAEAQEICFSPEPPSVPEANVEAPEPVSEGANSALVDQIVDATPQELKVLDQIVNDRIEVVDTPKEKIEVLDKPMAKIDPQELGAALGAVPIASPTPGAREPLKRTLKVNEIERTAQIVMANTNSGTTLAGSEVHRLAKLAFPNMAVNEGSYQSVLSALGRDPRSNIRCAGRKQGYYLNGPNPVQPEAIVSERSAIERSPKHDIVDKTATAVLMKYGRIGATKAVAGKEVYRLAKAENPDLSIEEGYYQGLLSILAKDSNSRISCDGRGCGYYLRELTAETPL